jgi:putative DNA primase/helicase
VTSETERAREALTAIPPDLPREDWVRAGMAAHAAGLGLDDFEAWSAGGASYDPRAARDVWRSFKEGKGIGAGTLFAMAKLHGYRPINGHAAAQDGRLRHATPPANGLTPAELFERFTPATADHPYIIAKQGLPDGLRVVPEGDPLRLAGESMAGALAVPVGDCSTLQLITVGETAARLRAAGKPGKLNLTGHSLKGGFTVGKIVPAGVICLCEGIGQAWACWKATGHAAVATFGAGRTRTIAADLRQQHPAARLVLVPDVGKEDDAEKIATDLGCEWVQMPAGWPANSDVNDLAQRDGHDVLEALLATPRRPSVPAQPRALDFAALSQRRPPARQWFIPHWLGPGGSTAAGSGGAGKSTLVQEQATLGGIGRALIGEAPAQPFSSLVINCEDDHNDLWRRQDRICEHWDIDMASLAGKLHIVSRYGCDNALMVETQSGLALTPLFKELREQVNDLKVDALWLDNVAHLFLGNHDDRTHVTTFVNALSGLVTDRAFAFILIAHPGKAQGSEYSGSVAWENAVRMRWYLGNQLPDQRAGDPEDEPPDSDVRYLAKRKANYTAQDYVRFTMEDGLLVPEAAPEGGISGIVSALDERRAEDVCIDGFRKLQAMGLLPSDSKAANDYLPKQLIAKRLNSGYGKADLVKAMNRLMTAGKFTRGQVGVYSNRTPKQGLILAGTAQ